MAMNPIAINDGGQFRFIDFVNYIPDFLKEEEDVVTLMQVFSDYLNNAYRNVEDSRKFYFNYIATESVVSMVKNRISGFTEKLRACVENGLYVYYLSMPRTNANSNSTTKLSYMNSSVYYDGEYGETLPINVISDVMENYSNNGDVTKDGDVIYIEFKDGSIYPYYINKPDNVLQLDSERMSQDPFHDTLNQNINGAPRIVKFLPKNIGDIIVTRIGQLNDVYMYDIKFEMELEDVQSVSSHYLETVGVDSVEMDYYGYMASQSTKTKNYVVLTAANGESMFEWMEGMPRGIFYFKELSEFMNGGSSDIYNEYNIIRADIENHTDCYLTLSSAPNLFVGDTFAIESNDIIGVTDALERVTLTGFYTVANVVGNVVMCSLDKRMPSAIRFKESSINKVMTSYNRLYKYGLYYNKKVHDYTNIVPVLRWSDKLGDAELKERTVVRPYGALDNRYLGELSFDDMYQYDVDYDDYGNKIYTNVVSKYISIPNSIALNLYDKIYVKFTQQGTSLSVDESEWLRENGHILNTPMYAYHSSGNKYFFRNLVSGEEINFNVVDIPAVEADKLKCSVYLLRGGIATTYDSSLEKTNDIMYYGSSNPNIGDICILKAMTKNADDSVYNRERIINKLFNVTNVTFLDPAFGKYLVEFDSDIDIDISEVVVEVIPLQRVSRDDRAIIGSEITDTTAKCMDWVGDIYTCDYWVDDAHRFALKCGYVDEFGKEIKVKRYVENTVYNVGTLLYYPADEQVYKVVSWIDSTDDIATSISFGKMVPYMFNVANVNDKIVYNEYMYGTYKVEPLEYGETVNLDEYNHYSSMLNNLYIEKADNNALYFNWKDREYLLNYKNYDTQGKPRTGFAEFCTTGDEDDIVLKNVENYSVVSTLPGEGVLLKNVSNTITITNKQRIYAERMENDTFKVTVKIEDHGFVDKSKIVVENGGVESGFDFDTPVDEFDVITVVNNNEFYFVRHSDCDEDIVYGKLNDIKFTYVRSVYNPIVSVAYYYNDDEKFEKNYLYVTTQYPHGYSVYTKVNIKNVPTVIANSGWVDSVVGVNHVIDKIIDEYTYAIYIDPIYVLPYRRDDDESICVRYTTSSDATGNQLHNAYSIVNPEEGDVISVDGVFYKVTTDKWVALSGDTIETPLCIYTHQNLFEITKTNKATGFGEDVEIDEIYLDGDDTVVVVTKTPMSLTAGKSSVYIRNVHPLQYNGRYVVNEVFTNRMFSYKIVPGSIPVATGMYVNNGVMTCNECSWYKYRIDEIAVNRKSVYDIYKYGIKIVDNMSDAVSDNYVTTEGEHGFNEGDRIVLVKDGEFANAVVERVLSKNSFVYQQSKKKKYGGGYAFKGVYIPSNNHIDNIDCAGIYTQYLNCIDSDYKFEEGDIVFACDQLKTDTPMTYIVTDSSWKVCSEKRVMKIKKISVDSYYNDEWTDATNVDNIDKYVYRQYSYPEIIDMMKEDIDNGIHSYVMPFHIRNFNFTAPYIEHLDTTQLPEYQFNSKHDYASVAPRHDMEDKMFKGIPDMKYPLIEKIDRLIYLRDANVIDYDLIGYLARFMGYDITDAKNDIDANIMYKTQEAKEKAVRETVSNLPQYYTLGGTKPGLEMLLATFGIVADVITMWTNLDKPYKELVGEDDLRYRQDSDYENGIQSHWAPTPHVKVRMSSDANVTNSNIDDEAFTNIIKNIKVFKPIQVVFDEFIKYVNSANGKLYISNPTFTTTGSINIDCNYDIDRYDDTEYCG